jgi:transposase-like protein
MEDYPKTLAELERRFSTEEACREYLFQLRWPDGFRCPACGHSKAWKLKGGLFRCTACGHKTSVIAGTLFEGTRKPLVSWFRVIWWVTSQKNGASALGLQRILGLGSYRTAWTWLHKLRRAMVRPGRDRLSGTIQVDETYIGGEKPGKRGRGAKGKTLVLIAAQEDGKITGRIRLKQIADASAESLEGAVQETVERGAVVKTDDWNGYKGLESLGYRHPIVRKTATIGDNLLPLCHREAALIKRWLTGTHQGAVSHEHLAYYLDEYTFRFNRRTSRYRGKLFYRLLQNAVSVDAIPYQDIAKGVRRQTSQNTTSSG